MIIVWEQREGGLYRPHKYPHRHRALADISAAKFAGKIIITEQLKLSLEGTDAAASPFAERIPGSLGGINSVITPETPSSEEAEV